EELRDWQFYRVLARHVGGGAGRIFSGISADEWRHAKRLSAAYFLISGIRYFPEPTGAVPLGSYLGSLRDRFMGEQNGAAAYLSAAEGCRDACLRELFLAHAKEEQGHARLIRGIVEQL
ncbi:MAG: rubrerythrin, partial [Evtepia sp.]